VTAKRGQRVGSFERDQHPQFLADAMKSEISEKMSRDNALSNILTSASRESWETPKGANGAGGSCITEPWSVPGFWTL
jgi:hypothetical protein